MADGQRERTLPASAVLQQAFARHLRSPESVPPPANLEDRRVKIYRDLVFNNLSSFLASSFPVLRKLLEQTDWDLLVREFIRDHKAQSPQFTQLGAEFVAFLQAREDTLKWPFVAELAHYEALEISLFLSDAEIPDDSLRELYEAKDQLLKNQQKLASQDAGLQQCLLQTKPIVSPLAVIGQYHYEVHRISPEYMPAEPPQEPVTMLVYRNREERVRFTETNSITASLLLLFDGSSKVSDVFDQMLRQVPGLVLPQLMSFALPLLLQFGHDNILVLDASLQPGASNS